MLLLHPVPAERVVIKTGVFKKADPLLPARRHVGTVVLIKILSEESWRGRRIRRPREKAESIGLLRSRPLCPQGMKTVLPSEPPSQMRLEV